jgi:hypothetical protein
MLTCGRHRRKRSQATEKQLARADKDGGHDEVNA